MSEISITLPLSTFGDEPVGEVIERIKNFTDAKGDIDQARNKSKMLVGTMVEWANNLNAILDGDYDDFTKRGYLRQFASETKQFATQQEVMNQ